MYRRSRSAWAVVCSVCLFVLWRGWRGFGWEDDGGGNSRLLDVHEASVECAGISPLQWHTYTRSVAERSSRSLVAITVGSDDSNIREALRRLDKENACHLERTLKVKDKRDTVLTTRPCSGLWSVHMSSI